MIQVQSVSKIYQQESTRVVAIDAVNFELQKGDSLAITGSSGAGKSTLLNILGGLDVPSSGKVLIKGKDMAGLPQSEESAFRSQTLGYVFQFHHLLNDFTLLENIMMPLLIQKISKNEAVERAKRMLKDVDLSGKENRYPLELSGGEQQRGAIARALIHKPELILADEPTGNLDERNGGHVFDLLCHLNHDLGATLIIVTHHLVFARQLKHNMILEQGRVKSFE